MTPASKRRWFRYSLRTLFVVSIGLNVVLSWNMIRSNKREGILAAMRALPDFYDGLEDYRVDPYIQTATELQAMPRNDAADALFSMAREKQGRCVFVLCRMLFVKKADGQFRSPGIGQPIIMGSKVDADWPLNPIELVNGVPFLVASSWLLGGEEEQPEDYIKYCLDSCDWNRERFKSKSTDEKQAALAKLLASTKWELPLIDLQREHLDSQIH